MPKIIDIKAWAVIILNGFDSWEVSFPNLVHKFPWPSSLVQYILDLLVKCLIHSTVFLNCFQSAKLLVNLNFSKSLLQFEPHQLLEYFEMLTILEFFSQDLSTTLVNKSMVFFSA